MKTLFILAGMIAVLFLISPVYVEAQKKKPIKNKGASDPKAANDKNFANAVSTYLLGLERSGEFCLGNKEYPNEFEGGTSNGILALGGLLKVTGRSRAVVWQQDVFSLTDEGRAAFTPDKGFCIGTPELLRIANFTEPGSSMDGYVMSRVTYFYRFKGVPIWVSKSNWNNLPSNARFFVTKQARTIDIYSLPLPNSQFQDTQRFVLTGKGWVHESLAPK